MALSLEWERHGGPPRIIAHRGSSLLETENTLAAIRQAKSDGADGVEIDVWLCRTGELVVFHDEHLSRLAGRAEAIHALSLSEIREVVLTGGDGIPTLDEAIEELGPGLLINIEIKAGRTYRRELAQKVASSARRHALGPRALVSTGHPGVLGHFRLAAPEVPAALVLGAEGLWRAREAWTRYAIRPSGMNPEHVLVTAESVRRWRRLGYTITPWTVDDPTEACRLASLGVDGIITNSPATVRKALL